MIKIVSLMQAQGEAMIDFLRRIETVADIHIRSGARLVNVAFAEPEYSSEDGEHHRESWIVLEEYQKR